MKSDSKRVQDETSPSHLIDAGIAALGDWRGEALGRMRALIGQADPQVVEELKWREPSSVRRVALEREILAPRPGLVDHPRNRRPR